MVSKIWPWVAAALSGGLLALAYPGINLAWAAWFALVPLLWALWFGREWGRREWMRRLLLGYLAGLAFFLPTFFWISTVTFGGMILLVLYLALYPAAWTWFAGSFCRPTGTEDKAAWLGSAENIGRSALGAAAWVGLEWIRGTLFSGFGWNSLGVSLHANLPLIQIADITGVGGLSFLIAMANLVGAMTLKRLALEAKQGARRPHWDFALTVTLVALAFVYGVRRLATSPPPEQGVTLKVAAVQPNIPQNQKWKPEYEEPIRRTFARLTEYAATMNPDLIVWPEAATPRPLFSDAATWEFIQNVSRQWSGDFLLGTVHFEESGDYNSAVLLTSESDEVQFYHKIHLVPFGEFVPFRRSFPLFAWIVGELLPEDFDHGQEVSVLDMSRRPVGIGALICFEDTLGNLARKFVLNGANLFVTITNDGWFLETAGSAQHAANSIFRAVENKIPMVRVANTGVTCFIDRNGRVYDLLADEHGRTFIEGVLVGEVTVGMGFHPTIYTRVGELFSILCLGAAALGGGLLFMRKKLT